MPWGTVVMDVAGSESSPSLPPRKHACKFPHKFLDIRPGMSYHGWYPMGLWRSLGARLNGIQKAEGSNPFSSTGSESEPTSDRLEGPLSKRAFVLQMGDDRLR